MDKRDKIGEILDEYANQSMEAVTTDNFVWEDVEVFADKILALFPESVETIEWVGNCPACDEGNMHRCIKEGGLAYLECVVCGGIGKITRPATIEDLQRGGVLRSK